MISSFSCPFAKAGIVEDYADSTFSQWLFQGCLTAAGTAVGTYFGQPYYGMLAGQAAAAGITDLASWYAAGHTDQELNGAYTDYVSGLETDLGTTTLIDGGVRMYFNPGTEYAGTSFWSDGGSVFTDISVFIKGVGTVDGFEDDLDAGANSVSIKYLNSLVVPFNSICTTGFIVNGPTKKIFSQKDLFYSNHAFTAGSRISLASEPGYDNYNNKLTIRFPYNVFASASVYAYANFIPVSGASLPTTNNITPSSRPGGIPVDGSAVFDEETMKYYNAVTKQSYTAIDWAFDYESRTYTFTLEDGTTATVVYGDNEITFTDHGNTYTLAYPTETTGGGDGEGGGSGGGTILGLLGKLLDLLGGLITSLLNGLKSLFVPSEDFFSGSLADLKSLFDGKMGLITYPTSVVVNFFDRVTSLDSAAPVFAWTDIRFMDTTLISAGSYNLEDALTTPELQRLHQIYLDCVSAILIFGFLDLCYKKYRDVINK